MPIEHYINWTIREKWSRGKEKGLRYCKALLKPKPKSNSENFPDDYMISLFGRLVKSFSFLRSEPEQGSNKTLVDHHTSRAGAAHILSSLQK